MTELQKDKHNIHCRLSNYKVNLLNSGQSAIIKFKKKQGNKVQHTTEIKRNGSNLVLRANLNK
jgi:hypothetical protein